ncbi:MAG: RNase adaptor protein RapZ, partial [Desulfovibrio sp.]
MTPRRFPFLVVTGLSGGGKSTALNVFEDLRFFIVDGLPASLVPKLVDLFRGDNPLHYLGLAVGMDFRHADFLAEWEQVFKDLSALGAEPQVLFLEARTDVLMRRYAATRRPHPLANLEQGQELGLEAAIEKERELLAPIRQSASLVIDTTEYSVHDLRRKIQDNWTVLEGAASAL